MLKKNTKNLNGLIFKKWKVLNFHEYKNRNAYWLCQCICGHIKPVAAQYLLNGSSTQCIDCAKKSNIKESFLFPNNYWSRLQFNATKRNIGFYISKEEAYNLLINQNFKCALSGIPIYMSKTSSEHNKGNTTASIDRINSDLPYKLDNIQWVHIDINIMKNNFDQSYFINICKKIVNLHDGL